MTRKGYRAGETGLYDGSVFNDQVDVATATIYNEYHVVLESGTKESDLDVFNIEDAGVGMLEDTLIAKQDWVENDRDLAVK